VLGFCDARFDVNVCDGPTERVVHALIRLSSALPTEATPIVTRRMAPKRAVI